MRVSKQVEGFWGAETTSVANNALSPTQKYQNRHLYTENLK